MEGQPQRLHVRHALDVEVASAEKLQVRRILLLIIIIGLDIQEMIDYGVLESAVIQCDEPSFFVGFLVVHYLRVDQGKHLVMVTRLDEGSDAFCHNLEVDDLITLPIQERACLVILRAEVLSEECQQPFIPEDSEKGVRRERLLVDVDRYCDSQLRW